MSARQQKQQYNINKQIGLHVVLYVICSTSEMNGIFQKPLNVKEVLQQVSQITKSDWHKGSVDAADTHDSDMRSN